MGAGGWLVDLTLSGESLWQFTVALWLRARDVSSEDVSLQLERDVKVGCAM